MNVYSSALDSNTHLVQEFQELKKAALLGFHAAMAACEFGLFTSRGRAALHSPQILSAPPICTGHSLNHHLHLLAFCQWNILPIDLMVISLAYQ
jgi:hypothetical protein